MKNREGASGAALAGALLLAMPFLDLFSGNAGSAFVSGFLGLCGLALVALSATLFSGKEQK